MRAPYKVIVWGPGGMGLIAIWEILQSKAFELVGVRAYSAAKHGVDVGALLGIAPVGLAASTDVAALLAQDCDCIFYSPRELGDYATDDELLELLAAGKNVVTSLPYQDARYFRDDDFVQRLNAACARGGSVFHATGVDPDLISDRVLLALTGLCNDITSIKLQENWDCSHGEPFKLGFIGIAKSPEEARKMPLAERIPTNFLRAIVRTAEQVLGVTYDRVVETHDYVTTPADIEVPFHIPAGTVARVSHRLEGFVDAKGPQAFFTMEYNWLIGPTMMPPGSQPGQYWVAEIEGRPSMRMAIDLRTSLKGDQRRYHIGDLETEPGYHAVVAPCLQAIPHICAAPPGVLASFGPALHWMDDLRDSVGPRR
jgi:hypothetical protein